MKKEVTYFDLAIVIVICCSNLVFVETELANMILAFGILSIGLIWMFKANIKIKPLYILLGVINLTNIFTTRQYNKISIIVLIVLYMMCLKCKQNLNMDMELFIKVSSVLFLTIILMYFLIGFNSSYDTTIWRSMKGLIYSRKSLGFNHPNIAMLKWLGIVVGIFSLINSKHLLKKIIFILVITFILYHWTVSRTSTFIIVSYSLIFLFFKKHLQMKVNKVLKRLLASIPLLFTLLSFILTKLSNLSKLNKMLSGRLVLNSNALDTYGITLLGNPMVETLVFDNAYLHMLISKGFIFAACFMILFYSIIMRSKEITLKKTILILGVLIVCLMETWLLKFELLLVIIIMLYGDRTTFSSDSALNNIPA